jgi:trehalose/maltose hydrolase-like predicted phosphorylase
MHTPELSFDGHGINGPDEYRTRIATFNWSNPLAKNYTTLFEAAPELLAMLTRLTEKVSRVNEIQHNGVTVCAEDWAELYQMENESKGIIAKATSR